MSVHLGGGWRLVHKTDRVIELRKECPVYRRFTNRDGYVKYRGEPGISANDLIERAKAIAIKNDEMLSQMVAKQLMPTKVRQYQIKQRALAGAFGVPGQEPERRIYTP